MTTAIGLVGNLVTGWMATWASIDVLTTVAMGLLASALLSLPFVSTDPALVRYAVVMGYSGGMVTVIFFTAWARLFGRSQLGRIQSVAQMMTVVASAMGPVILAEVKVRCGSYLPAIVSLGIVAAVLGVATIFVPEPQRTPAMNKLELATS
jgi:predicted MFS family arabinose efflux permease